MVKEDKIKFRSKEAFESILVSDRLMPQGHLLPRELPQKRPVRNFCNINQDDPPVFISPYYLNTLGLRCLISEICKSGELSLMPHRPLLLHRELRWKRPVRKRPVQNFRNINQDDSPVTLLYLEVEQKVYESESPDISVLCEPVIDILFAKVFTDSDESLDVYGDIKIIDGSKNFLVYERGRYDSPQRVHSSSTMNNFLQLSAPQEIPTFNKPHLVVDIRRVDTGAIVARDQQPLPKTTDRPSTRNDFESLYTLKFQGDAQGGGLVDTSARVEVQCVAFTFGVYAQVEMFLYKDDVNEDGDAGGEQGVEVYGLISAKCHPWLQSRVCYENHMFNVMQEEHEWVGLGTEIFLSKNLVAVPAYLELEISLDLKGYKDDEFVVQGTACFRPANGGCRRKVIQGENGFFVLVRVTWWDPSLPNESCCEEIIDGFDVMPLSPDDNLYASQLLEVFSLFIAHPNRKDVYLYGSVKIEDSRGRCSIFSRSKEDPYFLPWDANLLPLQGPDRALVPTSFSMKIDIHDIDGHVNIKGFVTSNIQIVRCERPWFDRRFCAVVRLVNEKSFVAVNYTLFWYSIQAILTVHVVFKSGSSEHVKILGNISASYDDHSYLTSYEKELFRRVLYTGNKENFEKVENNSQLCRNVVAVPMKSSLLCEVYLDFPTNDYSITHHVEGRVKFQIGERSRTISGSSVDICINVDWKGLPYV